MAEVRPDKRLLFVGQLKTPSRMIIVETVLKKRILEMSVPKSIMHMQNWTNGNLDTDNVMIGVA